MRIAALVLGIVGGILGIFGGLAASAVGTLGIALEAEGSGMLMGLGAVALLVSIFAIVAGALALKYPKFSGWSMIASAVVGFIAVSGGYLIAGILLLIGGILALLSTRQANA
jgi:hypothetical protein